MNNLDVKALRNIFELLQVRCWHWCCAPWRLSCPHPGTHDILAY
jgi:hypothetical protein